MNKTQALTEQDITELKTVMESFVSDLQKPTKQAKRCRWIEWKDERTGLMVGEYQ